MSFRTTYILFGVLIAMLLLLGFNQFLGVRPGDELYVLPDLHRAKLEGKEAQTITIERTKPTAEKVVFVRDDGSKTWRLTSPANARVSDQAAVNAIVSQLADARREERIDDLGANLAARELDPPNAKVTVATKDGKSWTLNVGGQSTPGDPTKHVVYVTSSENPKQIVAVRRIDLDSVYKTSKEFRDRTLVTPSSLNITAVDLSDAAKHVLQMKKEGEGWKFIAPDYGTAAFHGETAAPAVPGAPPRKITGVKDLVELLEELKVGYDPEKKVDDFVADNVTDVAKFGLDKDKPTFLRLGVTYKPGVATGGDPDAAPVTDTLLVGNVVNDDKEKRYARLESDNNVVKVAVKPLDAIAAVIENPNALRNRDLLSLPERDNKVDAIDLKNASGTVRLRKVDGKWKVWEDGNKSQPADLSAVNVLLNSLTAQRLVRDFPPASKTDADLGLDDKSRTAELSLWTEGLNAEEAKKDDKVEPKLKDPKQPSYRLIFGKKMADGLVYAIRERGKDILRVALPDTTLARVEERKIDFLDRALPTFPETAAVSKIAIQQGTKVTELERDAKDEKSVWKLKQPPDLAGRNADRAKVAAILETLRTLQAERLVNEKATPAELKEYQLDPAEIKVTLTMPKNEKETEDKVYFFGKTTANGERRYAKLGGGDLVFQVRPEVTTPFSAPLVDLQVFSFEPTAVKQVKLVGWKKVSGLTQTLEVERKGTEAGGWTLKTQLGDFALDGKKVDDLLKELARLKADKIIVFKKGAPPEHELTEQTRALFIEIWVENAKEPITLTIGKLLDTPEKEKGYAAQSSTMPGDVFLVPEGQFKSLVNEGLKYFSAGK